MYRRHDPPSPMLMGYDPCIALPADHLARLVEALVEESVTAKKEDATAGQPKFDPRLCLKVLIYGYSTGVRSSRQLEKHCNESLPYLFLTRGDTPSYRTLCSFRVESRDLLEKVWVEIFAVADNMGLKRLGRIVVDSTKLRANTSAEMVLKQEEYAAIKQELKAILDEAEAKDKAEDAEGYEGETLTGKKPDKLQMRDILRKVRRQMSRKKEDGDDGDPPKDDGPEAKTVTERMRSRIKETVEAIDKAESEGRGHLCVTDPDARMMLGGVEKKVRECHSLEMAMDKDCGLLVADEVTGIGTDNERLTPLVESAEKNEPEGVVAVDGDSGYYKSDSLSALIRSGVDVCIPDSTTAGQLHRGLKVTRDRDVAFEYDVERDVHICPQGNLLTLRPPMKGDPDNVKRYQSTKNCRGCPLYSECIVRPDGKPAKADYKRLKVSHCPEEVLEAMQRFNEPEHRERYHMRGSFIEGVNGFIRGTLGFDRWFLRGSERVKAEGKLMTTAYQLRTLHKNWTEALAT